MRAQRRANCKDQQDEAPEQTRPLPEPVGPQRMNYRRSGARLDAATDTRYWIRPATGTRIPRSPPADSVFLYADQRSYSYRTLNEEWKRSPPHSRWRNHQG